MSQNWRTFGKASTMQQEAELDRKRKGDQLRGWVAEYLDEGMTKEFWEDLRSILKEEHNKFIQMAKNYSDVLEMMDRET